MVDQTNEARLRAAIELLYFAYRAFTAGPDRVLAQRGLGRVHHRVLYFVARNPGVSVKQLLEILAISKQALHLPLRQLQGMGLVESASDERDARVRRLRLSTEGVRLEARLTATQMRQLEDAFSRGGPDAMQGWLSVMRALAGPSPGETAGPADD
ncbi:MAG: MarR family winged helix-turn-helix transcriptional regulator [Gammaproteobacteria bacterium]